MRMSKIKMIRKEDCVIITIKKQWYDLIASGIKRTEYRDSTAWYKDRLNDRSGKSPLIKVLLERLPSGKTVRREYCIKQYLVLKNGYSATAPTLFCKIIDVWNACDYQEAIEENWGGELGVDKYCIDLEVISEHKNGIDWSGTEIRHTEIL